MWVGFLYTVVSMVLSGFRRISTSWILSVVVADLVMEDVESRALSTYPNPPKFWKRYVDDTCCTLTSDTVQDFHRHLSTIEDTIQFTLEREAQAQLAFLDVDDGHLVSHV